jgi:hypothetical protein
MSEASELGTLQYKHERKTRQENLLSPGRSKESYKVTYGVQSTYHITCTEDRYN